VTKSKQKNQDEEDRLKVADRLHSAAIHLLRRVRKQDTKSGEGPARLSALSVLVFGGPTTLGQLAAAEQVKPPTMTRIVKGLERSHLVRREADPADARRVAIHATEKGIRLLEQARAMRIESLAQQLGLLPVEDVLALKNAVEILETVLSHWRESR
jgi:DNA-binding MarR family transcriptional regulator